MRKDRLRARLGEIIERGRELHQLVAFGDRAADHWRQEFIERAVQGGQRETLARRFAKFVDAPDPFEDLYPVYAGALQPLVLRILGPLDDIDERGQLGIVRTALRGGDMVSFRLLWPFQEKRLLALIQRLQPKPKKPRPPRRLYAGLGDACRAVIDRLG